MDFSNKTDRVRFERCFGTCTGRLSELVNTKIKVEHYVAHDVQPMDRETGEVRDAVRLVVISDKGETYECCSAGLLKSLQMLAFSRGAPPWKPCLTLTVKTKKVRERSVYWFECE